MTKEEIKQMLNNLLERNILTNNEHEKFVSELNNVQTEDALEMVRLKLIDFLERREDLLRNQFLNNAAKYADSLNELAESFKDDQELQDIVNEFNQSIDNVTKEFNREMSEIEKEMESGAE